MWKSGYDTKAIANDGDDDDWETDPDFVVSTCPSFDPLFCDIEPFFALQRNVGQRRKIFVQSNFLFLYFLT